MFSQGNFNNNKIMVLVIVVVSLFHLTTSQKSNYVIPSCSKEMPGSILNCKCGSDSLGFSGSLAGFLEKPFMDFRLTRGGMNRTVIISQCRKLKLNLNYDGLKGGQMGSTFTVEIQNASVVSIDSISLAFDQVHVLKLQHIKHRVSLTGKVQCYQCVGKQSTSSSIQSKKFPSLMSIEGEKLRHLSVNQLHSNVPTRITIRNSDTFMVTQSQFQTLPWPGIFVYNVTKAGITRNKMLNTANKAVTVKLGKELVISDNIMDAANALDVSLYEHMTIRCNKPNPNAYHSQMCEETNPTFVTEIKDFFLPIYSKASYMLMTVLATMMSFGSIWLPLFIIGVILLTCCGFCCMCCRRRKKKKPKITDKQNSNQEPPKIVVHDPKKPKGSILKKQTSLAKEKENNKQKQKPKPDTYVTVDRVSEHHPDDQENGVVKGHLSLGGEWPSNVKKIKAVNKSEKKSSPKAKEVKVEMKPIINDKPKDPNAPIKRSIKDIIGEDKIVPSQQQETEYSRVSRGRTRSPEIERSCPASPDLSSLRARSPEADDKPRRAKSPTPAPAPRLTKNEFKEIKEAQLMRKDAEMKRKKQKSLQDAQNRRKSPTPSRGDGFSDNETNEITRGRNSIKKSRIPVKTSSLASSPERNQHQSENDDDNENENASKNLARYTTV